VVFALAALGAPLLALVSIYGMFVLPGILSPLVMVGVLILIAALAVHAWRTAKHASAMGRRSRWIRWPLLVGIVLAASYFQGAFFDAIRMRWSQTFVLTSESMTPTLREGDYVLVDRRRSEASRGDVITYLSPDEPSELVGRVVGTGGDVISMVDGVLHLDSTRVLEPYASNDGSTWGPLRVPEGSVFVMGDHRSESFDSRHRGPTPVEDVTGHVRRVYFSRTPSDGVRWSRLGISVR